MARPRKPARLIKLRNSKYWYICDYVEQDGRELRKVVSTRTHDEWEARQWLIEWENRKKAPSSNATVSELLDKRLEDMRGRKLARSKSTSYYHQELKGHFGFMRPDQIKASHVHAYWQKREHRPGSLREELVELRLTLNFAKRNGWIESVPNLDIPKKRSPRDRFIDRHEAEKLLQAAEATHLKVYLLIAMTTAARKSAITGLTWDRVDFRNGRLDFRDPTLPESNKKRAIVPVNQQVLELLRTVQGMARTDYVIEYMGRPVKDIKKSFQKAVEKAGLSNVSPHVLKHSVISWLAQDGFTVDQISDMTATRRETVSRVYRHVKPDYLEDLAESLAPSESIAQIFSKPSQ